MHMGGTNRRMTTQKTYLDVLNETPKEKRMLRNSIAELLLSDLNKFNFYKKYSTFYRIHGEGILQIISIVHNNRDPLKIRIGIKPLYNYLAEKTSWDIQLASTKSGNGWEGFSIEEILHLPIQTMPDIDIEIEMLKKNILPLFDKIIDAQSVLCFYDKVLTSQLNKENRRAATAEIMPMLRVGKGAQLLPDLMKVIADLTETFENNNIKLPNKYNTAYKFPNEYPGASQIFDIYLRYNQILEVVKSNNQLIVNEFLYYSAREGYARLERYSKTLTRKFPFQNYMGSFLGE